MNTPTTEMIEAAFHAHRRLIGSQPAEAPFPKPRQDLWDFYSAIYTAMRAADTREDALREALEKIALRAKPHPDDTDDDRKRDLYHIASIARAALAQEQTDG